MAEEKAKKVLIATPTLGLWDDPSKWLATMLTVINDIRRMRVGHAFFAPYRLTWANANNAIWNLAFQQEFDYILRLDDDVWGLDLGATIKLFEADKDVIGARYPMRHFPYSNCEFNRVDKTKSLIQSYLDRRDDPAAMIENQEEGIVPVDLVGFGLTLIKVAPFRTIERPIYKGEEVCPDDTYFAQLCIENGIQQYVHTEINLCHRDVTPLNRIFLFNADARWMIRSGIIHPGNKWYDELIELFGPDGQKDFRMLKGLEEPKIIVPR